MEKLYIISIAILAIFSGCAKDEITIYNNYEGNSSDSTGYYNIFYHNYPKV